MDASKIVTTITDSFTGMLNGTGEGIVGFFDTIFSTPEGTITTLGILGLTMLGVGFGVWIIRKLLRRV